MGTTPRPQPPQPDEPSPPCSTSLTPSPTTTSSPLILSPLPPTPPRTSSTISSSRPSPLLPSFSRKHFAHGVTAVLVCMTDRCDELPASKDKYSLYYGIHPPPISTKDYVDRLLTHAHCSPSAFTVALIYLRRLARRHEKLRLCPENLHRLVITALTVAVKMLDDRVFSLRHYARVGGVPNPLELFRLEKEFLFFSRFRIFVRRKSFQKMLKTIWDFREHPLPKDDGVRRPGVYRPIAQSEHKSSFTSSTKNGMGVASEQTVTEKGVSGDASHIHAIKGKRDKTECSGQYAEATSGEINRAEANASAEEQTSRPVAGATDDTHRRTPERRASNWAPEEVLTRRTANAETGKAPIYGVRKSPRPIMRREDNIDTPEEMLLEPTIVEDDSGVLDDDEEEERDLEDFEIELDEDMS